MQAALSVLLLVGAGLFLRSFSNVRGLDLGIDLDRVVTLEAMLPPLEEFTRAAFDDRRIVEREVYRRLEDAVVRLPGVEGAAISVGLPLDGGSFSAQVFVPGRDSIPNLPGRGPFASSVSPGYFETVGTRIVRGRPFVETDREDSEPIVIINETMATVLWPGGDALDRCLHIGSREDPCRRIVGVAENVHRTGLREQPSFQYYLSFGQPSPFGGATLVIRTVEGATLSPAELRRATVEADARAWAAEVKPLEESISGELRPLRIGIVTFGISGALALVVALVGLYSLMSYLVTGRRHEIGVRVALGATRRDVVQLVLRGGVALAAIGVAIGLVLATLAGPWLEPHLFETPGRDLTVMLVVAVLLLSTAALAGWAPARIATRISPTDALRTE